jgi:hypothetical protein
MKSEGKSEIFGPTPGNPFWLASLNPSQRLKVRPQHEVNNSACEHQAKGN